MASRERATCKSRERLKGDRGGRSRVNKKRKTTKETDEENETKMDACTTTGMTTTTTGTPATTRKKPKDNKDSVNSGDNRTKWCIGFMDIDVKAASKEFIRNKKMAPADFSIKSMEAHDPKNRYNDIQCMDQTRVILKDRPADDDYIHASWMIMPDGSKYICTQGPLPETVVDFWHMVFTEKAGAILMVCNFVEGGSEKCALYFPKTPGDSSTFGPYKVTLKDQKPDPFETIRYHVLEVEKGGSTRTVHHLALHAWADHTAPLHPGPTVSMLKMAREKAGSNCVVAHCSAGIGRSATLVGIDFGAQKIKENADISMIDVVKEMRNMRLHSVQSAIQYIYLHVCILEFFVQENVMSRKGKVEAFYDKYRAVAQKWTDRKTDKEKKKE